MSEYVDRINRLQDDLRAERDRRDKRVVECYNNYMSVADIMDQFHISANTLYEILRRQGVPLREDQSLGSKSRKGPHDPTVIDPSTGEPATEEREVQMLVEDYKSGMVIQALHDKYGRGYKYIYRTLKAQKVRLRSQ